MIGMCSYSIILLKILEEAEKRINVSIKVKMGANIGEVD